MALSLSPSTATIEDFNLVVISGSIPDSFVNFFIAFNSLSICFSSLWVNIHGHKVEKINSAIKNQIDKVAHSTLLGVTNPSASLLAKKLIDICPSGLGKVFYSGDGASAVEAALKMAFQYWLLKNKPEKNKFICLRDGYHGDTLGAVSVGGIELFHSTFKPLLFDSFKISSYDSSDKTIYELESLLDKNSNEIAALIIEPYVQAAGGIKVANEGYLVKIRELCDKFNVLFKEKFG